MLPEGIIAWWSMRQARKAGPGGKASNSVVAAVENDFGTRNCIILGVTTIGIVTYMHKNMIQVSPLKDDFHTAIRLKRVQLPPMGSNHTTLLPFSTAV